MRSERAQAMSIMGAVTAAVAASACCIGPLALAALGLGGAGLLLALEPYRPLFGIVTFVLLGAGFYRAYGPVRGDACGCEATRGARAGRAALWGAAGLSVLVLLVPSVVALASTDAQVQVQGAEARSHATLRIEGMTCASCGVSIRTAAEKLDGVRQVKVDYATGTARAEYDPEKVSPSAIAATITELGYPSAVQASGE